MTIKEDRIKTCYLEVSKKFILGTEYLKDEEMLLMDRGFIDISFVEGAIKKV